jgi:hypothetical protein
MREAAYSVTHSDDRRDNDAILATPLRTFIVRAILLALAAAVALSVAAPAARAQGSRKDDIVFGPSGHPIAGATITVCQSTATGTPCSPLATLYTDATLTVVAPNPFQGDGIGNYHFYAPAGRYMIQITGPGISGTITYPDVILPADTSSSGAGNNISAFGLTLGGNLSVAGNANISGTLTTTNFNPGSFTPSSLNVSGNASLAGPRPWVDVTASPYGAKGDGVTDDTAAIQSAINAVCNASTGLTGGGIIYFPAQGAAGYSVTQAQGGSSSLAPVFTIPCNGLTFRGGGQRGAGGQQFVRSPATSINVATLGSNPSAGPIFCLNGCGGSSPNNSITFEDLVLAGYNQALYNFATNTNLRNVFLKNQATGFTGSGTTYTDNVALVQKGFWFEWNDGVLFGNALMPVDNSGGGPYDQTVENIQLNGSQFIVDVRQNFAAGVQGTWFFQNVTRENATAGQDFIFLVNHTGNNCGTTALPGGVNDITVDHFLDADASPTTMAIVHSDATMAGCLIAGINIRNSIVGNAGGGLAIEMSGGTLQGSVVIGDGSTQVVDGNGNPTGGAQIVTNRNGNDAIVFTGNDDPRGGSIPRRLGTDLFLNQNPPAPGWALTASGNQQRSLAGDPVAGVLFGSGVDYGYTENISQATREALDIGFATVLPPSSFAGTPTTGGSLAAGTYYYSIRTNNSGNCGTNTADSAPAIIATGIAVGGSDNAVALTWTPVQGTSTVLEYCIQRQTGSPNFFNVSTGFQIAAPASSYTDTGANPGSWSGSQIPYTNPMASAHRFTPTSLGVNTTNPQFNLDVNGSAAVNSLNGVAKAERFAGADAAAQINACLTAAQAAATVCDARGLKGTLTGAHHITIPAGTVLLWGQAQLTINDAATNDAVELTGDGASILGYQESGINTLPNTDTAGYIACGVAGCTTVRNPNKAAGKINFVHIDGMYLLATGANSTVIDMTSIGHSTVENNSIVLGTGGNSFGIFGDTSTGNQDSTNTKFYHNNIEPQGAGDACLSLAGVFNAVVIEQNTCILPHVGSTVIGFQFKKDSNANYPNNDEIYGNDCESANPSVGQICYNVVNAKSVTFGPNNRCEKVYACFQPPSDGSATGIHFVDTYLSLSNTIQLSPNEPVAAMVAVDNVSENWLPSMHYGFSDFAGPNLLGNAGFESWQNATTLNYWGGVSGVNINQAGSGIYAQNSSSSSTPQADPFTQGSFNVRIGDNATAGLGINSGCIQVDATQNYTLAFRVTGPTGINFRPGFRFYSDANCTEANKITSVATNARVLAPANYAGMDFLVGATNANWQSTNASLTYNNGITCNCNVTGADWQVGAANTWYPTRNFAITFRVPNAGYTTFASTTVAHSMRVFILENTAANPNQLYFDDVILSQGAISNDVRPAALADSGPGGTVNAYSSYNFAGNVSLQANTAFTGAFTHANTANRTYTLPDASGTVALQTPLASWGLQHAGAGQAFTSNTVKVWGIIIPYGVSFSHIDYDISTLDSSTSDNYDIGLYGPCAVNTASCPLVTHIGAQNETATGYKQQSVTSATIQPGLYWIAITGNAATAQVATTSVSEWTVCPSSNSTTTSSGGALPSSIATPNCAAPQWTGQAVVSLGLE